MVVVLLGEKGQLAVESWDAPVIWRLAWGFERAGFIPLLHRKPGYMAKALGSPLPNSTSLPHKVIVIKNWGTKLWYSYESRW